MNPSQTWGYFQLSWGEQQPGFQPCLVLGISRRAGALEPWEGEPPGGPAGPESPETSSGREPGNAGLLHSLCALRKEL